MDREIFQCARCDKCNYEVEVSIISASDPGYFCVVLVLRISSVKYIEYRVDVFYDQSSDVCI